MTGVMCSLLLQPVPLKASDWVCCIVEPAKWFTFSALLIVLGGPLGRTNWSRSRTSACQEPTNQRPIINLVCRGLSTPNDSHSISFVRLGLADYLSDRISDTPYIATPHVS